MIPSVMDVPDLLRETVSSALSTPIETDQVPAYVILSGQDQTVRSTWRHAIPSAMDVWALTLYIVNFVSKVRIFPAPTTHLDAFATPASRARIAHNTSEPAMQNARHVTDLQTPTAITA